MTAPAKSRRAFLGVGAATLLAGCAGVRSPRIPAAVEVAPGVFVFRGLPGEIDDGNLGRVGNAGFIVGDSGVIAVDTGVSHRHGVALLDAIGRTTSKPVRTVVVTQAHQEFLFGAAAFRDRGIPIRMHRKAALLMRSRCENCLKTLRQVLGEGEMRGTSVIPPDVEFDDSHRLDLIGRPLRVLYFGHSSGPGDVAVLDEQTGTLFAGGLLDNRRIPDVQDSDLPGWHLALAALRKVEARTLVPGHGPAVGPEGVDTVERYLSRLQARLLQLLDEGAALSVVPDETALPEFEDWDQYNLIHRRNASIVFLRLEREQLLAK